jgi:hypothetical protein
LPKADDEALINYAKPIVAELRANMARVDSDFSATPFKAKVSNAQQLRFLHHGGPQGAKPKADVVADIILLPAATFLNATGDEVALDGQHGKLCGLTKVSHRSGGLSEFGGKSAAHGMVEMVAFQHGALRDVVERVQPRLSAVNAGDGDGAVHRSDRRTGEGEKPIIEVQDAGPVGH